MPICPASTFFSNLRAVAPDWVKMAVPLPSAQSRGGSASADCEEPEQEKERAARTVVTVDKLDGVVERVRLDDDEDRAEDLLPENGVGSEAARAGQSGRLKQPPARGDGLVAVHVGRRLEDGRADKVAVREARDIGLAAVEQDLAALVGARLNEALDALAGGGRNEGAAAR